MLIVIKPGLTKSKLRKRRDQGFQSMRRTNLSKDFVEIAKATLAVGYQILKKIAAS